MYTSELVVLLAVTAAGVCLALVVLGLAAIDGLRVRRWGKRTEPNAVWHHHPYERHPWVRYSPGEEPTVWKRRPRWAGHHRPLPASGVPYPSTVAAQQPTDRLQPEEE